MHIVGTAGHVDHGKSSLVRALTGTDPDRWAEEQRRGMTLDLGFAHLRFEDGSEAGIIDVPGHERFLHNMLAGAAGMEVVLLVIAANEGVKPQTLEHLAILRYLRVQRTLIVLTKSDTVEAGEPLRAAADRVRTALAGTIAADSPLLAVSTVRETGLTELRAAIHATLVALTPRAANAPAYLPVDRVFALTGHGTIVTGTLMQGSIAIGDTLALAPLERPVRVRSLHVFGRQLARVTGGMRVAVNLPGVETTEIARGAVLASAQFLRVTRFAVIFEPLPNSLDLLRRRTPVRAYIGAAEILGTLVFTAAPTDAAPVPAVLILRAPTIAVPGAPFVVRRVSPMTVLGGGTIGNAGTEKGASSESPLDVEPTIDTGAERERLSILAALTKTALGGGSPAALGAAANLSEDRTLTLLADLVADGRALRVAKPPAYLAAEIAHDVRLRTVERLEARQRERPWLLGSTSIFIAQALGIAEAALVRILIALVERGELAYRGGYFATLHYRPQLTTEQRTFFDAVFALQADGVTAVVGGDDLRIRMRVSTIPELPAALETLLGGGELAKVDTFYYRGSHIKTLRAQLEATILANGAVTVAQFRDATKISRKYAVPLLEFFDATGVTLRVGDTRVLRRTATTNRDRPALPT